METEKQEISSVTATDGEKKPRGRGLYEDKAGRVVLRNLQFDIKEKHLKQNFAKFGKIIDASIPLNPENSLNKGFGFIEFSTRDEARKAIQEMNGKPYKGRTIAIDFALSKRQYNRKIDEIIQKNPIKKKEKKEEEQKEEAPKPKQDSDSSDWNSEPEEEKPEETKTTKKREFKEKFKAQGEQKEKKERQRSMKKYVNDAEEGLTLFVRNIDYSTTEAELKEFFEEHGEVYFARLVKSKDNPDVHKGFAFVKFKNKEVVEKLAELSSKYWGDEKFKLSNAKVADIEAQLEFKGRRLVLFKAESKNEREKHKEALKEKVDKRNIDFVKIGLVTTKDFTHEGVSEKEMETRIRLFKKKQESLKKNPNLFVSKTRLSLRELDKRLNEKTFAEFINWFINDWKQTLPKEELKVVKTQKLVLQYKLLTDKEKTGEDGKPKPSGIGFIELGNEDLALYLVNNLNNFIMNKRTGKGLIVDFAIEDHRKLLKRKQKLESLKRKQKEAQKDKEKKTLKDKRNKKDKEPEAEAEPEVKVTIDQISDIKELEKMMRDTNSRGKRNRIKKRIQTLSSGSHPPPTTVPSVKKQTEAEPEENSEDDGGVELSQATREMMKKAMKNENKEIENSIKNDIKRNIRKKKHLKMKKEEDFDDVFKVFEAKINKRLKMIEDAGEEDQKDKDEWEFRNVEIEDI